MLAHDPRRSSTFANASGPTNSGLFYPVAYTGPITEERLPPPPSQPPPPVPPHMASSLYGPVTDDNGVKYGQEGLGLGLRSSVPPVRYVLRVDHDAPSHGTGEDGERDDTTWVPVVQLNTPFPYRNALASLSAYSLSVPTSGNNSMVNLTSEGPSQSQVSIPKFTEEFSSKASTAPSLGPAAQWHTIRLITPHLRLDRATITYSIARRHRTRRLYRFVIAIGFLFPPLWILFGWGMLNDYLPIIPLSQGKEGGLGEVDVKVVQEMRRERVRWMRIARVLAVCAGVVSVAGVIVGIVAAAMVGSGAW